MGGCFVAGSRLTGTSAGVGGGSASVLTASDFTYLGAFLMPQTVSGHDTHEMTPLAHRYVGGNLHFFGITHSSDGQNLYEVNYPGVSVSSPPTATLNTYYGNPYSGKNIIEDPSPGSDNFTSGLYWDETGQRLYWIVGVAYSSYGTQPTVGYCTLSGSTATSPACYYLTGVDWKRRQGGMCAIPTAFANTYLGGKRLGVGFGSYKSAGQSSSLGPTLFAIDPPTSGHLSTLANVKMLDYASISPSYPGPPLRCRRDPDYDDDYGPDSPVWDPTSGGTVGWFQWNDAMAQSGVWIDIGTKRGVLFGSVQGHGRLWYELSTLNSTSGSHAWYIYDPDDLAQVVLGAKQSYECIPTEYDITYPLESATIPGWTGIQDASSPSFSFDSTTNILYVGRPWAASSYMRVLAYQVA